MRYISTRGGGPSRDFAQLLTAGSAPDGGLYMPESRPQLSSREIAAFAHLSFAEVAFEILRRFTGEAIAESDLRKACKEAYATFRQPAVCPLVEIAPEQFILELFHGPTLAFKDIAMQLVARLIERQLEATKGRATIICATSGDTGGAAVHAFKNSRHSDVVVLFPRGRISDVQRRQMTASGGSNVYALAIEGSFDDAQAIVKALFADHAFTAQFHLTAVNSVNWARIAAQITYYFTAAVALGSPRRAVTFCIPTGNFGDAFAGYAALKMGLPVERLIIATNSNDILVRAFTTGRYETKPVSFTTSPSMDIQVSSNFERLLFDIYNRNAAAVQLLMAQLQEKGSFTIAPEPLAALRKIFSTASADEKEVKDVIRNMWRNKNYLVDPHTAVGLAAAEKAWRADTPLVTLATAHPAKFPQTVLEASGTMPRLPEGVSDLEHEKENYAVLPANATAVKAFINETLAKRVGA